ncbi:MAG: hypothetical protein LAO79_12935 [Acidobacteriia bacterium]|nr:hypothetical protein [Terriglobia bacterium]
MRYTLAFLLAIPAICADWNPRAAADYMDARQKAWFAWPQATRSGAACISCHTGMTYLLARPELRHVLGEKSATEYERGYSQTLRARADKQPPSNPASLDGFGTDSVLAAMLLTAEDRGSLSPETLKALDRMWAAQKPDGGWPWYSLNDDPWEMPESRFFGASLAAVALGNTPADYRARPEVAGHVSKLAQFLSRDQGQPLQNRLMLLWASAKVPDILPAARRKAILDQARQTQQPDGGWTIASLGPWSAHPEAAVTNGTNAYATAIAAFALEQAGLTTSDPMLARALDWLRAHQSRDGYWDAASMNHKYEAGSMMELFMRDAATGFAAMALLHGHESSVHSSARP